MKLKHQGYSMMDDSGIIQFKKGIIKKVEVKGMWMREFPGG